MSGGGFIINDAGGGGTVDAASVAAAIADDPAAANDALSGLVVDGLAGTGWVAGSTSGGAGATWETSPARLALTLADGAAGSAGTTHATRLPGGGEEWDFAVRPDCLGTHSSASRIGVRGGASGSSYVGLDMLGNGTLEAWASGNGTPLATAGAGPDQSTRESGLLWLRVARRLGQVSWSWGVAADTSSRPTAWTVFHTSADVGHLARAKGTAATLSIYAGSGVSGGVTVNVLEIRASGRAAPL
jgi:hypothetical protein